MIFIRSIKFRLEKDNSNSGHPSTLLLLSLAACEDASYNPELLTDLVVEAQAIP
jgi:hypothetical protein